MIPKLFFYFLFFINISFSQEIQTKFVSKTPLQADTFIGVDEFDHTYYLKNNVLYKNNEKQTLNYSNLLLGRITSINIQNPFKLVVFYKEFNSVVLLDNNLNELTNRIDFTKESLFNNVQFVSPSSENNLWLFADDNKLHLYDYQNLTDQIQTQAINFYQNNFIPNGLKSTYKNVWVLAENGIIQFNEYGNYIQYSKIDNISNIFPLKKNLIYYKDNSFYSLEQNVPVPIHLEYSQVIKNIYINNSNIYIFDGTSLYQFKLL